MLVLTGFCIPHLYHIGPESCGPYSILISMPYPLKISVSPVKHCLRCLVTQTKPI